MSCEHNKRKYFRLDICKYFLAVFIIARHTHLVDEIDIQILRRLSDKTVSLSLPVFFAASGFLLFVKMQGKFYEAESSVIIRCYIIKMLRLYCVWNLIYLPFTVYDYVNSGYSFAKSILKFVHSFIFIGTNYLSWPFWFLLSSIIAISIIYVLLKKKISEKGVLCIAAVIFLLAQIMTLLISISEELPWTVRVFVNSFSFLFAGTSRLFMGMGYLAAGMGAAMWKTRIPYTAAFCCIVIMFLGHVLLPPYLSPFCLLVISFLVIYLLTSAKNPKNKECYGLRKASRVMYFTHMLFFAFYLAIRVVYPSLQYFGVFAFLTSFIGTQILSFIVLKCENKKHFKWLKTIL